MRSLTLHSGKKWIQQTHDDYPLESSQKSHDITTNHMFTPMPKIIQAKKIQVPLHVQIQHPILILELIVPPMWMEDFKTLGHPTPNVWVKRPILVDKDQLVKIF